MKKVLIALSLVLLAGSASAQWHHHYGYQRCCYRGYDGGSWIAPALIGGVIGYELSRPRPVIVEQPPVVVQQQPVIVQNPPIVYQPKENCSAWIETQQPDGAITRTRTCTQ